MKIIHREEKKQLEELKLGLENTFSKDTRNKNIFIVHGDKDNTVPLEDTI